MPATATPPAEQQRYVDFDEYVDFQLRKTRDTIKWVDIATSAAWLAVAVLAWLLVFVICDHWIVEDGFSTSVRVGMFAAVCALGLGWMGWKVLRPYLKRVNELYAAREIDRSQPQLKNTLLNLVDLRGTGRELTPEIRTAMERRAAVTMSRADMEEVVDRRPLLHGLYALCGLVVLFSLYAVITPKKVSASVWRALLPTSSVEAPTQTVIAKVMPGNIDVIPGTRLEVLADIEGDQPENIQLRFTTADREFVDEAIDMRAVEEMPGRYRAEIIGANGEGIQQSMLYYVEAGDDRSADYTVTLLKPPHVEITELRYTYPKYMDREPRTQAGGDIDDYEGVTVTFEAEANQPLTSAVVTFSDEAGTDFGAEHVALSPVDEHRRVFRGEWTLSIPDTGVYPQKYSIACRNEAGHGDPQPTVHSVRIHPDKRPEVKIVRPKERELHRPANAAVPLIVVAKDDFKVQSLTLWKQKNNQRPVQHEVLFKGAKQSFALNYKWQLDQGTAIWSLKTGDRVTYWAEARDNNTRRPGRRNTEKQVIVIEDEVSQEQAEQDFQKEQQQNQDELEKERSENEADGSTDPMPEPMEDTGNEDQNDNPRPRKTQDGETENQRPQPPQDQTDEGDPKDGGGGGTSQQKGGGKDGDETQTDTGKTDSGKSDTGRNGDVKKDGSQDGDALESLHKHQKQDQQEGEGTQQDTGTEKGTSQTDRQEDTGNPDPSNPGEKGDPSKPQPKETPGGEKGADPQPTPDGEKGTDPKQSPDGDPSSPMPKETPGDGTTSDERTPDSSTDTNTQKGTDPKKPSSDGMGTDDKTKPKTGTTNEGTKPDKQPGKTDTNDTNSANEKTPMPDGAGGESRPSDNVEDKADGTTDKPGGAKSQPKEKSAGGRDAKEPIEDGTPMPTDDDPNAKKRDAIGDETGTGTPEDDPNAKPKRAKNDIQRKDGTKPATRPGDEGGKKPNAPKDGDDKRKGSGSPENADPTNTTKQQPKQTATPDERDPNGKDKKPLDNPSGKVDGQPDGADDELKGKGRPNGQKSEKNPTGGEGGSSKQNTEGTKGSNQRGPGDRAKDPGLQEPSQEPNGGKSSDEAGPGSRSRETDERPTEDNKDRTTDDRTDTETRDEPGDQTDPNGRAGEERKGGAAGQAGTAAGKDRGDTDTARVAEKAEKANLEYGEKAADLALKKLGDELDRGEVNEDWLKEMGWTEKDAADFLRRMKQRKATAAENTPEALAKKRQYQEWLKRLKRHDPATVRRDGGRVKNHGARDTIDARSLEAPPQYRDLFNAFKRSSSARKK